MITLLSMSVFGADKWNWISPIFAFFTLRTPSMLVSLARGNTRPRISWLSSIVPPSCFTILMFRRSTCFRATSLTCSTASTAIGASTAELLLTTFEESDVEAARRRLSRSSRETGIAIEERISWAFAAQRRKQSAITVE